jgi:hypothetical protein
MMEVLVAVAVAAILGFGLWFAVSHAGRLLGKASRAHRNNRQVLFLDDVLRRELGALRVPFWEGLYPVEGTGESDRIVFPFLNGRRSNTVRIEYIEGRAKIWRTEGDKETLVGAFGPFASVSWKWVEGNPGTSSGLRLTVHPVDGVREISLFVPASSHPFVVERADQ